MLKHVKCGILSFPAPVLRYGMPYLWLKDCHVAALLAMTQNWNVFIWKTDVFHFLRLFFARCCSAPFFKRFVPEIVSFSRKTHQNCHCEEGAFLRLTRQSLTKRFVIPKRTMVGRNETKPWKEERGSKMKQRISCFL